MSLSKRHSTSPPQDSHNLKHRVITCLNKLSDRDTLAVATTELESIARNLTHEAFSPFLTCLSTTDSSEKSPVRRQCVRLLGLLSAAHGDALSPHLSKMLSAVLRRLRDPDTAVRSACVDAVASMAAQIKKPPFSAFLKPLVEAVSLEQDCNSQIGASLCLAAAIDATPDPDSAQLQKLVPKLLKLVKSDCFKAKPALLSLIGSIVSAGGASNRSLLNGLVQCLVEFMSSEDWAARKAATEALGRLAVAERNLLPEFRSSCLASLESRRFDRVKVVRETMNRSLELWREVPGISDGVVPQSQVKSSSKDRSRSRSPPSVTKTFPEESFETPQLKKGPNRMHSLTPQRSLPKSSDKKHSRAIFCKLDNRTPFDRDIEVDAPQSLPHKVTCEERASESGENGSCGNLKLETKRVIKNKTCDEEVHKFGGLRSGCRVVPFQGNDDCELGALDMHVTDDECVNQKDAEDMSLIRKQLLQIQNQQFNLFDLLQRFIGSSQSGMNSLETRVNGLEKALDEISCNLAVSTGRVSNTDSAGNSCCMLPGAEFLSPKFWRRAEGQNSSSRFSFYGRNHSPTAIRNMPNKDANAELLKLDGTRGQHYHGGPSVVNRTSDPCKDPRGNQDAESTQIYAVGGLDRAYSNCMSSVNLSNR